MKEVNVKVAVRARPFTAKEGIQGHSECVFMKGKTTTIADADDNEKHFNFDHCYSYNSNQKQVYEDLAKPIVKDAIDGFNGCLFAYGQTGSGKTHSMMGTGKDVGIIPLLCEELFGLLEESCKAEDKDFLLTAAYLEIYNEVIRDLLNPSEKQLRIRENPKTGIYVENLAELVVKSTAEIQKLLDQGNQVKKVEGLEKEPYFANGYIVTMLIAATNMNDRSSRSHCCFFLNVQQRKVEEIGEGAGAIKRETVLSAKINLVDLAGSERVSKSGATGDRLKEGSAINKSLTTLGLVINLLSEKKTGHIPYRDSKLTRILQPALGGNARTVMLATISPSSLHYQETLSTLKYASRASHIKNEATRNEDVNERVIRELREEVERLRSQMEQLQSNVGDNLAKDDTEAVEEMKRKIDALENAKKEQWLKVQEISVAFEKERQKNLSNHNKILSVMQDVRENNVAIMKSLKKLQIEKNHLLSDYKGSKDEYIKVKDSLEEALELYQKLSKNSCETETEKKERKACATKIKLIRKDLMAKREELNMLKQRLEDIQELEMEKRAEVEAQRTLLEGDEKIRKAIEKEEREKLESELEKEKSEYLKKMMQDEKCIFEKSIAAKFNEYENEYQSLINSKSQLQDQVLEYEMKYIDAESQINLLSVQLNQAKLREQNLVEEIERNKTQFKALLENMLDEFDKEKSALKSVLRQASKDAIHLYQENSELKKRLSSYL